MLIEKTKTAVSLLEFKQFLHRLSEYQDLGVCIRVRIIGQLWQQWYMRVLRITDSQLTLFDESRNKLVFIKDVSSIIQFEIDHSFQNYRRNVHYDVTL